LELPHTFFLALQNPFIGIGSFGRADAQDSYAALAFVNSNVAPVSPNITNYLLGDAFGFPGYNAHTAMLGSFLFAGILALPFWIFVLYYAFRSFGALIAGKSEMPAVLMYLAGLTIWDTFFSPLTTRSHIGFAIALFVFAVALRNPGRKMATPAQPTGMSTKADR
jgi:hypothetical protein